MEEGRFHKVGKINIVELFGNYRQMGRQYGKLFKNELNEFYKTAIEGHFIKIAGMSFKMLNGISNKLFSHYPPKFKEILCGMNEASGIDLNSLVMLDQINIFEFLRYQDVAHCSNIAAWGDYTKDRSLIFGRNFDQPEYFKKFIEFITVVIFNPNDMNIPTANIGYAGQIGISSAMNRKGIFIANNETLVPEKDEVCFDRTSVLIREFDFLLNSSNLNEMDRLINSVKANCPVIVSVADKNTAYSYEWTASDIKLRSESKKGLMVATNHFVDPLWERPEPASCVSEKTLERRQNLLSLGEKYKGKLNVQKMKEILDTTIDKGGATHLDKTIFQIVAVPGELKIHLKIPGFQDWSEIHIGQLFNQYDKCLERNIK